MIKYSILYTAFILLNSTHLLQLEIILKQVYRDYSNEKNIHYVISDDSNYR